MKPCCDKAARGIVCEHFRDALLDKIWAMWRGGVPGDVAVGRAREFVEAWIAAGRKARAVLAAGEETDHG